MLQWGCQSLARTTYNIPFVVGIFLVLSHNYNPIPYLKFYSHVITLVFPMLFFSWLCYCLLIILFVLRVIFFLIAKEVVTCGLSHCFIQDILEKIAPTWMNVSLKMKDDPETDKAFGWVLEM